MRVEIDIIHISVTWNLEPFLLNLLKKHFVHIIINVNWLHWFSSSIVATIELTNVYYLYLPPSKIRSYVCTFKVFIDWRQSYSNSVYFMAEKWCLCTCSQNILMYWFISILMPLKCVKWYIFESPRDVFFLPTFFVKKLFTFS